jgi:hypothetical protein
MPGARVPYEVGSEEYYRGSRIKYPNPFFDLSSYFIPSNIKTLFKYCRGFYYTNGFIRNIITKLTEYPITDILIDSEVDQETKTKFLDTLRYHIKIKQLLIEIGLDYYTFGNCFISANLRFKRYLICNFCKESFLIENIEKYWKFKNFEFHGTCPSCGVDNSPFKYEDKYIKNPKALKFIRWAPEQIDIEFDELTGESIYYYKLSGTKKKKILSGNKKIVARTPKIFLQALKEKKLIQLDKDNLYHFKRPTLAEENMGWGKPAILPAMKDLYYLQTLRRGNEAVAHEHIVPKKAIFPAANGPVDPFQSINLGKWRGQMEEQIAKWKRDPNHIGIFPFPIGYQQLGGDAKMLLLAPELKFLEENIITNMGLPVDFVKGGATWTGSSISLRIVENHFLPYREMLVDFINFFVVGRLHVLLDFPKLKVKLKELKMTDDSEAKQVLLNMRETNQVSHKTLLNRFGLDYREEMKNLRQEAQDQIEAAKSKSVSMALAQGIAQEVLARHEARAQYAMQDELHRIREKPFEKDILAENANLFVDSSKLIEMLAIQLSMIDPKEQERVYADLAKRAPITAALVLERFLADQVGVAAAEAEEKGQIGPGPGAPKKPNKKENQPKPKSNKIKGASTGDAAK